MKISICKKSILLMASLLISTVGYSQVKSVSRLIEAELQEVNTGSQLVMFNNQRYKYQPDLKNATYQYEEGGENVGYLRESCR